MKLNKKQILSILLFSVLLFGTMSSGSTKERDIQPIDLIPSAIIPVIINEIHYNPATSQGSDSVYEFAEIYNNDSSPVDLTGWTFAGVSLDGINIAVGGYVVIAYNGTTYNGLASATCSIVDAGGYFGLSNSGNTLDLLNGVTTIESVTYDDFDPWSTLPDGGGPSLERINPNFGSTNTSNWGASAVFGGTPCASNSIDYLVDTFPLIESHSHRSWTPTAGSDITFEVKATDNSAVTSVTVDVSSDNFVTNTTLTLLDGDSDDVYQSSFTVGATGTSYTYGVTVEDNAAQITREWNNLMNFTVMDAYPFISGFSPSGGNTEFITISFDGRGSASSYDLAGHELLTGGEYIGSLGNFDVAYRFPAGSSIQDGETIILTENGTQFELDFGFAADFEFNGTSSAIDMITVEFGSFRNDLDLYNGEQEISLIKSGSVLDAVMYSDFSTPGFRGDTGLSILDMPSASSQYGIADRDNDDPENDFVVGFFPYIRPNNVLNNSQVGPNFEITLDIFDRDGFTTVVGSWDGAANVTLSSPYKTNVPSALGPHTLIVYANDSNGFETVLTYAYVVSDAPVISLVTLVNDALIAGDATVSVSIVDSDGVGSVNYNWNGAANASLAVEVDNTYDITGPSTDGAHTLNIYSEDVNGAGSSVVYTFTVDATNPVITLVTPVDGSSVDEGTVVDLDVTDTNLATVTISVNDAAASALASPYDHTLVTTGTVKLDIVATDDVGNTATLTLTYTVIADITPTSATPTSTTPTSTTPTTPTTSDEDDSPGFVMLYALIAFVSVVQLVKFKRNLK